MERIFCEISHPKVIDHSFESIVSKQLHPISDLAKNQQV
jgi:hypothetical protein